jgi:hypothetical protein
VFGGIFSYRFIDFRSILITLINKMGESLIKELKRIIKIFLSYLEKDIEKQHKIKVNIDKDKFVNGVFKEFYKK